jgi:hypothetical protein
MLTGLCDKLRIVYHVLPWDREIVRYVCFWVILGLSLQSKHQPKLTVNKNRTISALRLGFAWMMRHNGPCGSKRVPADHPRSKMYGPTTCLHVHAQMVWCLRNLLIPWVQQTRQGLSSRTVCVFFTSALHCWLPVAVTQRVGKLPLSFSYFPM